MSGMRPCRRVNARATLGALMRVSVPPVGGGVRCDDEEEQVEIIRHGEQREWLSDAEPWRLPIRFAVNRESGAEQISVWQHYYTGERRAPLHWHDMEEVLIFLEVEGEGYVWYDDREYPVESNCSVVIPPNVVHSFGMHGPGAMRTLSILPDADARPGPRVYPEGEEAATIPPPDQWPTRAHPGYAGERQPAAVASPSVAPR
jgi:quercetin dioxygenase-like cupin family protein